MACAFSHILELHLMQLDSRPVPPQSWRLAPSHSKGPPFAVKAKTMNVQMLSIVGLTSHHTFLTSSGATLRMASNAVPLSLIK